MRKLKDIRPFKNPAGGIQNTKKTLRPVQLLFFLYDPISALQESCWGYPTYEENSQTRSATFFLYDPISADGSGLFYPNILPSSCTTAEHIWPACHG
jgi:hypothetical protein